MVQHSTSTEAAPRTRLPAKLANRRMGGVIDRERLFAWFDAQGERPLLWIGGPAGAGKTTLVSTWLARTHTAGVWYRVDAGDGDPATVFTYLALAARAHSRKRKLQLPALTPEYLLDLPGFARRYFGLFFAALPARCVLVLDALEAAPGPALAALLPWALQELLPGQRLIVTSREAPPPALAHLHARGELATLAWDDLRLSSDEARLIAAPAAQTSATTEDDAQRLHALCDGWAAGYVLLLDVRRRGGLPGALFGRCLSTAWQEGTPSLLAIRMSSVSGRVLGSAARGPVTPRATRNSGGPMNFALRRRMAVGRPWRLALTTALWCWSLAATAATVDFQGLGKVVPTGLPDAEGNLPLQVLARNSDYSFGGARRWRLESRFVSNIFTGVGSGTFRFYSGGDDLSGSVTMLLIPGTEFGAFDTSYTVEGGSGRLVGFSGLGRSTVTLLGPQTQPPTPFEEVGQLSIARHDPASDRKLLIELGIAR